jgi:hypothetical protein
MLSCLLSPPTPSYHLANYFDERGTYSFSFFPRTVVPDNAYVPDIWSDHSYVVSVLQNSFVQCYTEIPS